MTNTKPLVQIAIPGLAIFIALAVAMGGHETGNVRDAAMLDAGTPYSADHARIQQASSDSEQPPTF